MSVKIPPITHKTRIVQRFTVPMHDGFNACLFLPRPMRGKDVQLLRDWLDICEDELTATDPEAEYEI